MKDIQQLIKKNSQEGRYEDIFPKTFIDAVLDKESGVTLTDILAMFNMLFLSYNGSRSQTRLQVPSSLRREGLWVTYVLYDKTVVTEWYNSDDIDDTSWGSDSNWRKASNALVGDISISTNDYWVINGVVTNIKAQGETGITPLLRMGDNNKIQVTYDEGKNWEDISDYIVPKFRWNQGAGTTAGTVQISMDLGSTWKDLSNPITNNFRISKYIGINESLPTSGVAEGTIYMKGPYYDENDSLNENPIYRMWVYAWKGNTLAWQDNGEFTSISAGVVQERGTSTTQVMSQDAVTRELTELESENERQAKELSLGSVFEIPNGNGYIAAGKKEVGSVLSFELTPSDYYGTSIIPVRKGDRFWLTAGNVGTNVRNWCFTDLNRVILSVAPAAYISNKEELTAANDGYLVVCNQFQTQASPILIVDNYFHKIDAKFEEQGGKIKNVQFVSNSLDLNDVVWNDGFIDLGGNPNKSLTSYKYSSPISLKKGQSIIVETTGFGFYAISTATSQQQESNYKVVWSVADKGGIDFTQKNDYTAKQDEYVVVCVRISKEYYVAKKDVDNRLEAIEQKATNSLSVNQQSLTEDQKNVVLNNLGISVLSDGKGNAVTTEWHEDAFIAHGQVISDYPSYKYSHPILLRKGECIKVITTGWGFAALSKTDEQGSSYRNLVFINTGEGDLEKPSAYFYTAKEDMYVAACVRKIKSNGVFIFAVDDNIRELLNGYTFVPEVTLVDGAFISFNGEIVVNNPTYSYTQPYLLKKGATLFVESSGYDYSLLSETDKNGTYRNPLIKVTEGSVEETTNYQYTAKEDIYLCICVRTRIPYSIHGYQRSPIVKFDDIIPTVEKTKIIPMEFGGLNDSGIYHNPDTRFFPYLRSCHFIDIREAKEINLSLIGFNVAFYLYNESYSFIKKTQDINEVYIADYIKIVLSKFDESDISFVPKVTLSYKGNIDLRKNVGAQLHDSRFVYEVNNLNGNALLGNINECNDPIVRTYDCRWLKLPANYSNNGEPTRLAIYCHGSGGMSWGFKGVWGRWIDLIDYLNKEGYAVMCIFGVGRVNHEKYTTGTGNNYMYDNMGTPIAMSCYQAAYRWAIRNFNFKTDGVVVFGKSLGGSMVGNLMYQDCIPVLAAAGLAPTMDVVSEIMRNRPACYLQFYADQFGMEGNIDFNTATAQQKKEYFQNNAHKTVGYNPIFNGLLNANHKQLEVLACSHPFVDTGNEHPEERQAFESLAKIQKVPYKVWIAVDDINVDPRFCDYMQKMVQNGGGIYQLRWMPANTGKHWAVDRGETYDGVFQEPIQADVKPLYSDEILRMPVSFIEMVSWWRRFEH